MKYFKKIKLRSQTFLTSRQYNRIVNKRNGNCLSFAFGQVSKNFETFDLLTVEQMEKLENHQKIEKVDICEAFIQKAKEFGYNVKLIDSLETVDNKVVFIVLGWYTEYIIKELGGYEYFFHVIRKNEDGSFEEKPGWYHHAKKLSKSELTKYFNTGIETHYFVLC